MKRKLLSLMLLTGLCAAGLIARYTPAAAAPSVSPHGHAAILWVNHHDLRPGNGQIFTTTLSGDPVFPGNLGDLTVDSAFLGDEGIAVMGLQVPPGFLIRGVRICYELKNAGNFITQIQLAQVQDPPSGTLVLLDNLTDLTNPGPICVDSMPTSIDPSTGAVHLYLRANFSSALAPRSILIRALGLHLLRRPGR